MKYSPLFFLFLFSAFHANAQADKAFINGKIYTADADQSFIEAVAITDGVIVFTGDMVDIEPFLDENTAIHDLDGKLMLPGLHDVHIHLLEASSEAASSCTLDPWAYSIDDLGQELSDCNPTPNSNGWVTAWGHSIFTLLEDNANPREVLDTYFPDIPVAAMEETSHSVWVNSAALEEMGIDGDSEDPVGGLIVMEDGEPNGILMDSAGDIVLAVALATNAMIEEQNYAGLVDFGLPAIAEFGITSICEGRTYWKRNYIETWEQIKADGELTARVTLAPWGHPEDDDVELLAALTDLYDEGDQMLKVDEIKVYVDGITLNGTAALDQPYVYNFGWPFTNGTNYFTPERLEDYITQLELIGYDFHIHAIGNRGVQEALDAIEGARNTNGDVGARHRMTHLEIVNESEYTRFAELNVVADVQVSANWTQPAQWAENEFLVGASLSENFIPIKSIYDAGARTTLSSDWDVSTMNPFRSIQNAVTRAPQNLPSVEAAVDARTINSAWALGNDAFTGSIEVGKLADLICVNQDIFTIQENQISQTEVTMTMLGGEIIFEDTGFPQNIDDSPRKADFAMNPSITRDYTTISLPATSQKWKIEVFNSSGARVFQDRSNNGGSYTLNCDAFNEGVFVVRLSANGEQLTRKLLVYR
ncbi:MAG: putative amidohydrolase YtcJ [Flavobacteriales bacterium]|jgi:predicted amidohydrolase YtcJ